MTSNDQLTERVIGCAYKVYNTLGHGFVESVYEKALFVELIRSGLSVQAQVPIQVKYEGVIVGDFLADMFVEDVLIVELKAVRALTKAHEVQLVNYLTATEKTVGLLINFGEDGVEVKRKYRDYKRTGLP